MIYDRDLKKLVNQPDFGTRSVHFLYNTVIGRVLLRIMVTHQFSQIAGLYYRSRFSVPKINKMIDTYAIKTSDFREQTFSSFYDFFIRDLKKSARPVDVTAKSFVSVADARLSAYDISDELELTIKKTRYHVSDLVQDDNVASGYAGGVCLVFRLAMDDCHRYIYNDYGKTVWTKTIDGTLHTVQKIAHTKSKVFAQNQRIVSMLSTKNFGEIVCIEIGALLVGVIHNHATPTFKRGDEKGYFGLGGSSIVLLVKPGMIKLDPDIKTYAKKGIEVKVMRGMKIGEHA